VLTSRKHPGPRGHVKIHHSARQIRTGSLASVVLGDRPLRKFDGDIPGADQEHESTVVKFHDGVPSSNASRPETTVAVVSSKPSRAKKFLASSRLETAIVT
jgi:hypothetical protein